MPWWLHVTRWGRFAARHKNCRVKMETGSNQFGYFSMYECDEWDTSWSHSKHRYGVSSDYPFVPFKYWNQEFTR